MCVVETILDETLFENNSADEIYGHGSLMLGPREGSPSTSAEISITLKLDKSDANNNVSEPNLQGGREESRNNGFLRGSKEGV